MWSSTLPTGTVRNERRADRTYPRTSQPDGPIHPSQPRADDRQSEPTTDRQNKRDRLQEELRQANAEIQRLEAEVDRLQREVAAHADARQRMVDRYERVIAELEAAAATASQQRPSSDRSDLRSRLRGWLSG